MNILYCGDKNILDGLIISVLSLAKQTKEDLNIFVLTMYLKGYEQIPYESIEELDKILKKKNPKHSIKLLDITEIFYSDIPKANLSTFFTPYCLLRLYADLVPELPSKLLYLDTDVVALKDPYKLYRVKNTDYELVGVVDYYGQHWVRTISAEQNYMNSGVLLMNLDLIRETGLFKMTRARIGRSKMLLPDQTSLNIYAQHKMLVDRKFNEQKQETDETVFRHFSTTFRFWPILHTQKIKPWNIDKVHNVLHCHAFDDVLDEYLKVRDKVIQ
ncbi:glycosyltransferase family 8 protein [Candidatus Saccharibacteria bacterium]|nr:glycosyltransferase family 8 protein [Candidatus Saccharibacteria bacterium]